MIPFLKEVALDVLEKFGDNFSNLNFVTLNFPGASSVHESINNSLFITTT